MTLLPKFDRSNEVNKGQFANMYPVLFKDDKSKFVIFISFKDLQPENIYSIDLTFEVSKFDILKFLRFESP